MAGIAGILINTLQFVFSLFEAFGHKDLSVEDQASFI